MSDLEHSPGFALDKHLVSFLVSSIWRGLAEDMFGNCRPHLWLTVSESLYWVSVLICEPKAMWHLVSSLLPFFLPTHRKLRGHKLQYHNEPCDLYPLLLSHPQTKQTFTNCSTLYYRDTKLPPSAVHHRMCAEEWVDWSLFWKRGLCSARCQHKGTVYRGVNRGVRVSGSHLLGSLVLIQKRMLGVLHSSKTSLQNDCRKLLPHPFHTCSFQTCCWLYFLSWVGAM